MFAQCPACLAVFEINAAALVAAHGRVRCGECGDVFDTLRTLTDRLPERRGDRLETLPMRFVPPEITQTVRPAMEVLVRDAPTPVAGALILPPSLQAEAPIDDMRGEVDFIALTVASDQQAAQEAVAADADDAAKPAPSAARRQAPIDGADADEETGDRQTVEPALAFAAAFAARDDGLPRFASATPENDPHAAEDGRPGEQLRPAFLRAAQAPRARNARWLTLAGIFALVLGAELAWAERARWIDNASARVWLDPLCSKLRCKLPLRSAVDRLQLLSRDVRPHPSVPGALIISATLRNDAAFAQAFPRITITLSDLDEQRVAMRRFKPRDYLHDADAAANGIGAGATTTLAFEVADPGKRAIAFEFAFER